MGVGAHAALKQILGGEPIKEEDIVTKTLPEEMYTYLMTSHEPDVIYSMPREQGYTEMSRYAGKRILQLFEAHPEIARLPNSGRANYENGERKVIVKSVFDAIDEIEPEFLHGLDLTGFMVGWGLNAAKIAFGKPPGSNAALLTIE